MTRNTSSRNEQDVLTPQELERIVGGGPSRSEDQVRKASTRLGINDFTADMGAIAPTINDFTSDMG